MPCALPPPRKGMHNRYIFTGHGAWPARLLPAPINRRRRRRKQLPARRANLRLSGSYRPKVAFREAKKSSSLESLERRSRKKMDMFPDRYFHFFEESRTAAEGEKIEKHLPREAFTRDHQEMEWSSIRTFHTRSNSSSSHFTPATGFHRHFPPLAFVLSFHFFLTLCFMVFSLQSGKSVAIPGKRSKFCSPKKFTAQD